MKDFFSKQVKRISFLIGECWLFLFYVPLLIKHLFTKETLEKEYDIAFFPNSSPSSIGTYLRITQYEELLKQNQITYKAFFCITEYEEERLNSCSHIKAYIIYSKILSRRIKQIKMASKAKICFVQRTMFPNYVNQHIPLLEKTLKKQGTLLIVDFWDSVWVKNEKLTQNTAKISDLVSVTNPFLYEYFNKYSQKVEYFNIGVDLSKYRLKENFEADEYIKLVYIGYPANVSNFIKQFEPIAKDLNQKIKFKLVLITNGNFSVNYCETEYYKFDYDTYTAIISNCDIGLYLVNETDLSKGKTAMKVMDYLAAGIAVVASPWGVHDLKDKEHLIIAKNDEEYIKAIIDLSKNLYLRKELGINARLYLEQNYSLQSTFNFYKHICAE